jgi:aminocarboxymuconate-semialdehyde decarboxylase
VIVDCHAHLAPPAAFERAQQEVGSQAPHLLRLEGGPVVQIGNHQLGSLPPEMVDSILAVDALRHMGVDAALFSPPPFLLQYELPPAVGVRWARILNDSLSELLVGFRGMYGLATVPLQDPAAAAVEVERAVTELRFRGVEIASNVAGIELDNPTLGVFYEAVQELDVPILIHPHYVAGVARMRDYHLRNLVGNPLDTSLAAARLILGGVLDRFPRLKVCLSHAGGYFLAGLGRLDRGYLVRLEAREKISKPPSAYLENFYFDTIGHSNAWLQFVVGQAGANHVLLGTDLPFDMGDPDPVGSVTALGLDQGLYAMIAGENAERLFALPSLDGLGDADA